MAIKIKKERKMQKLIRRTLFRGAACRFFIGKFTTSPKNMRVFFRMFKNNIKSILELIVIKICHSNYTVWDK